MDINELIYNTLTSLNILVYFEEGNFSTIPDEYIEFNRIYGDERNYADGKAVHNYHLYRVNYYGTNKARRETVMRNIKTKMKEAGFFLQTDNEPIPREENATHWGAYSEFAFWEVINENE
jgi:hypothetical protein